MTDAWLGMAAYEYLPLNIAQVARNLRVTFYG